MIEQGETPIGAVPEASGDGVAAEAAPTAEAKRREPFTPAPANMPMRRRVERIEHALTGLASDRGSMTEQVAAAVDPLGAKWLAELKAVVGPLVTREGLDLELAAVDLRIVHLVEQLAERAGDAAWRDQLVDRVEELLAIERARGEAAVRAEMTGRFAEVWGRIEFLEEALGEAARRLRTIEGTWLGKKGAGVEGA
jgi:hypothetical protein